MVLDRRIQEILDRDAEGFIQKPLSIGALSEKLPDLLKGRPVSQ